MKIRTRVAASLLVAVLVPLSATSQRSTGRPSWPKEKGAYVAASSETIPAFPRELSGYRSEDGKDFWDKPFPVKGTMRVFQGNGWQGIPKFPSTMNGCSSGVFMIRWRSADPSVHVQSSASFPADTSRKVKSGAFGYMSASNCEEPMFNFGDTAAHNGSTLVDVYYELKFWQAAP